MVRALRFCSVFLLVISVVSSLTQSALPNLVVPGFSWAENLVFDGLGNMFVSDSIRGELWKINLCKNGTDYCNTFHLNDGFSSFGGLQVSPDGMTVYAGATLTDGTFVVVTTPTNAENAESYTIIAKTKKQPNGMACDWNTQTLYYTNEGSPSESGMLVGVDLKTGAESILFSGINGADGAWFDAPTNLLYVGLLTDKKVVVFNVSNPVSSPDFLVREFPGLSTVLGATHMLDDITLLSTTDSAHLGSTVLLGADWLGSELQQFTLDGTAVQSIPPPAGIDKFFQLTSVRWGRGPGFDPSSVYVTEGGGLLARQTDRRVIQIPMIKK